MSISKENIIDALTKARDAAPRRGFEQSVDLMVNFRDLDMRRPENRVNLRIQLPNDLGGRRVLVFATGDLALRARRAGADRVLSPPELQEMASDRKEAKRRLKEYDVFIAEAPLMPTIGRVVGPILGPKGKMPTPVPPQAPIDSIIQRERRTIILRSRDQPFVHCIVGKEGMDDEKIADNVDTVFSNLTQTLQRGERNIRSASIKLTMGPSVKLL